MSDVQTPVAETVPAVSPDNAQAPQTPAEAAQAENPPAKPEEKKSSRQMTFTVLDDGQIRAEFGEGLEPLVLNPLEVPEALHAAAMAEGLISRLRGYTSKLQDSARTPAALHSAVAKGIENLKAGTWKIERAPGEGAEYSIEVEAAFMFRKMRAEAKNEEFTGTMEQAAENFSALSDDEKKKLKALPRYQLAFAQVKAARAAKKAETLAKKITDDEANSPM